MSSTGAGGDFDASNLVDGIYEPPSNNELMSIAHSGAGVNPWWRVDLQGCHCVVAVNILNRGGEYDRTGVS